MSSRKENNVGKYAGKSLSSEGSQYFISDVLTYGVQGGREENGEFFELWGHLVTVVVVTIGAAVRVNHSSTHAARTGKCFFFLIKSHTFGTNHFFFLPFVFTFTFSTYCYIYAQLCSSMPESLLSMNSTWVKGK